MALKDLRWFSYEDKKWDLMNLLDDNTYEIIRMPTVIKYLPEKLGGYIKKMIFQIIILQ